MDFFSQWTFKERLDFLINYLFSTVLGRERMVYVENTTLDLIGKKILIISITNENDENDENYRNYEKQ